MGVHVTKYEKGTDGKIRKANKNGTSSEASGGASEKSSGAGKKNKGGNK